MNKEYRIIIAGSRTFSDYKLLEKRCLTLLSSIPSNVTITIISGNAKGADKFGELFAERHNLSIKLFPAKWNAYGKKAGYMRNEEMAKYAVSDGAYGILAAFWDCESKGTKHMINLAERYGLTYYVFNTTI